jgi:drug/metabolite transporter (DMT)-like permease
MSNPPLKLSFEFALPGVLAVLWGSSYLFTRLALASIPPLTLIATRVAIVALMVGIDVLQASAGRCSASWPLCSERCCMPRQPFMESVLP